MSYVIARIFEAQCQTSDLLILAKLQSCKAQFLNRAASIRIEEIKFIDVNLVIYSVNKGRVYGVLKISQRFKVGDLFESD